MKDANDNLAQKLFLFIEVHVTLLYYYMITVHMFAVNQ
jgi:hypothetical protein